MSFNKRRHTVRFSDKVYLYYENNRVRIHLDKDWKENIITLQDRLQYTAKSISNGREGNKGSHSVVLRLFNPEDNSATPLVLKICAYTNDNNKDKNIKELFKREVKALNLAKSKNCRKVIDILESGELFIDGDSYSYYVMEYADNDLANYLMNYDLEFNQKVLVCYDLLIGLQELHNAGVYHRDIKHDNLLMCGNECKLADLGLVRFQDEEGIELRKKLGAYGWEAPEAINKFYVEREKVSSDDYTPEDDCKVDNKSDVYQIAKVFWYVFNRRIPIGQVVKEDFKEENCSDADRELLFNAIYRMLLQNKSNRMTIDEAVQVFKPLADRL